jgi:hypothetical protein
MGMKTAWVRLALVCVALTAAAAVAVGGGGAANRTAEHSFDALPGPGRTSYGKEIAYRATFTNIGGTAFTHVAFRMRVPTAVVGSSTLTATFVKSSCPTNPATVVTPAGTDWVCSFGKLTPGTEGVPQLVLTVVWNIPTTAGTSTTCPECLVTNGRWTIKEGVNDQADPNDAFPPGGKVETATILDVTGATGQVEAGGYQLPSPCGNALGAGSLGTNQTVTTTNKVSTTICLPAFATNTVDLGLASTIVEENLDDTNPAGHPNLGRSRVCIATLGQTCGAEGSYTPFAFTIAVPAKFAFRISSAALAALYPNDKKITQVFHNGVALPKCPSTEPQGCYTSIDETGTGQNKFWLIEAQAPGNGLWGW